MENSNSVKPARRDHKKRLRRYPDPLILDGYETLPGEGLCIDGEKDRREIAEKLREEKRQGIITAGKSKALKLLEEEGY